jgi:hypothetical protein
MMDSRDFDGSSHHLESSMSSRRFNDQQMAKIKRLILEKHQLKKDLNDIRKILLMKPEEYTKHEYLQYRIKKLNDMWPRLKSSVYPKFGTDPKTGRPVLINT